MKVCRNWSALQVSALKFIKCSQIQVYYKLLYINTHSYKKYWHPLHVSVHVFWHANFAYLTTPYSDILSWKTHCDPWMIAKLIVTEGSPKIYFWRYIKKKILYYFEWFIMLVLLQCRWNFNFVTWSGLVRK